MIALQLEKGILWNTRKNEIFEIEIPDRNLFMDSVANTITKGVIDKYFEPKTNL